MSILMPCGEPVDLQHVRGQEHVKRALYVTWNMMRTALLRLDRIIFARN